MKNSFGHHPGRARRAGSFAAACCLLGMSLSVLAPPGAAAADRPGAPSAEASATRESATSVAPESVAPQAVTPQAATPETSAGGTPPAAGTGSPAAAVPSASSPAVSSAASPGSETGAAGPPAAKGAPGVPGARADLTVRSEFGSGGAARSESAGSAPSAAGKSAETGAAAADDNTESVWRLVDGELTFDYRITVVNHGPSRAVDVVITDELPPALTFVSSPDGCTAQGRTIRCGPLPALAVGRSHTWMIIVALDEDYTGDGSDITNVAVVSSATEDPDPDNNAATHTGLPVPPRSVKADLALRKTAVLPGGKRYVSPGDTFSYRITVRNLGPGEARGVLVTDPLPAPLVFDSSPDGCRLSAGSARTVTCPVRDRLAAGDSAVYVLVVRVPASGPRAGGDGHGGGGQREEIDNIATVTARTPDPVLANNSNAAGTTGPGGGPLHLVRPSGHTTHPTRPPHTGHPSHPANPGGPHHPGRPQLPHTGGDLPGWLPWSAALTLAGGCALVVLARRGGRSRH